MWTPGPWLECFPTACSPRLEELAHARLGHPVKASDFTLRLTRQDSFHDDTLLRHAPKGVRVITSRDNHVSRHPINMSSIRAPEAAP